MGETEGINQVNPKSINFFKKIKRPPYLFLFLLSSLVIFVVGSLFLVLSADLFGSKTARSYVYLMTQNGGLLSKVSPHRYCVFGGGYITSGEYVITPDDCKYCFCSNTYCSLTAYAKETCEQKVAPVKPKKSILKNLDLPDIIPGDNEVPYNGIPEGINPNLPLPTLYPEHHIISTPPAITTP